MLPITTPPAQVQETFHPLFVSRAFDSVRMHQTLDSEIRIRIDATVRSFVTFNAYWLQQRGQKGEITRRVHLEAKLNDNNKHVAYFMLKPFDEQAIVKEYDMDNLNDFAMDVKAFLCLSRPPV